MTLAPVQPRPWSWRRWGGIVALVFIVQLGLIYWLGSHTPIFPRSPTGALTLHLGSFASPELQALNDPTLFALPHPEPLSGPVPRKIPRAESEPFVSLVLTNPFPLVAGPVGAAFGRLLESNTFHPPQLPTQPDPAPTLPSVRPLALLNDQSLLQLADGLAQRRLLAPPQLKSYTNADILADSVVRVGVDAAGRAVSVTLLSSSGLPLADQSALDQAWAARFEPLGGTPAEDAPKPATALTWGRMVFRWHTLPPPATAAAHP